MWEIKGKNNAVKAIPSTKPEYNGVWMEECYVTVNVESPTPVNFEIGDYIIYRGERFEINYDPGKIKCAPRFAKGDAFRYENIKFNSLADELTRCDFLDVVLADNQLHFTGLPKFSFYGNVQDLANRMQANLDRTYGKNTWRVVVSSEYTDRKEINVSVDNIKVQGALSILVNDFEAYYTIKGRTLTIGAAGVPAGHLFKYGKDNGLYEIEQNAEADQAIVTRLRVYGSTRNLPHRYYNSLSGADGHKFIPDNMAVQNLMLPSFPYTTQDPYIDSPNIAKLGIREDSIFFDGSQEGLEEIYPSIEGMTAEQLHDAGVTCNATGALDEIVSAEQMTDNGVGKIEGDKSEADPATFKVTLKDLGFDINDHFTTETATLSFKTGKLGGREFEIVDCKKEGNNYVLELNRVYDDSIKLWFPYKDYNAATGDKFVLLHIEMPEVYIKAASQRLLTVATEWLSKNDYSRSVYAPKIDEIFMARQHDEAMASGGKIKSLHDTIREGMLLLFEDEDLNIDASIFIDRLTIKEDGPIPTYEVVLKEEKTVGRLDKMQNQIDSLAAGKGQGGAGGYTAAQIRSLLEAYGRDMFLSRKKDDIAAGHVRFVKGLTVGMSDENGMDANGDVTARDVTGRKVAADRGNFGDILMGYLSSAGFAPGLLGSGAGIWQDGKGKWHLDVDAITARQSLTVLELLIQRIRSVGGAIVLSQASGKVAEVVETGTGVGSDSYYRLYLEDGGDGDFVAGDFVRCSHWAGDSGNPQRMHAYWEEVVKADRDPAKNGRRFIGIRRPTETGVTPSAGDELVLMGSRVEGRQGLIEITTEAGQPRITEWAGIDSPSLDDEKMMTCLGDLTGIEWQGRRLTGYGLMTRNFYGTGEIVLSTGKTAEEAFSELGDRVSAMRQGVRNLVLNSGAWTPDRNITITPGQAPGATMPAHWTPLNDGCAAAVADGLLVLRKDSALKPDGTAASRNGLHAGLSRDAIPKGTTLTVKVAGEAGNIAVGKSIQVVLYNTQPEWTHSVVMARVTAADLAKDGSLSIEKSVTLAEDYSVPRLCVSLHNANEGAFIKLANVGLYAGDRAPELWTPAPEDAEERQAEATAAAKAAADNAKAAAEAAKQDAQSAKDAADKAAQDADKAVADLEDKVKTSIRDGILTAAEKASLTRQLKEVHGAAMEMQEAVSAITSNSRLPGENWTEIAGGLNTFNTALGVLNSAIGAIVNAKELTSEQLKGYGDTINAAYDGYNSAISALRAAIERGNAAIQSAIEAEARDAADKAAQAVADGLSARNLVPMSGLWEAVPGKDDGWGMLNGGCVASVADHRLSMVKDGDGRNGMWAGLTVPSLPKGQKVTLRVKGMVGREFVAGDNDDGTPSRVIISLYNTSPEWTHNVWLAEIREAGDFEVARTVELGQDYSVPKLCFSMQNAPEGTGLRLDWVALYAGSWAPGGWTPAPEDARRMVTAREASIRHDFEVSETGLSDRIDSSVTEYRTRFGALRNLLLATQQGSPERTQGTQRAIIGVGNGVRWEVSQSLTPGDYTLSIESWSNHYSFSTVRACLGSETSPTALVGWHQLTLAADRSVTVYRMTVPETAPAGIPEADYKAALRSAVLRVELPSGLTAEGEIIGVKLAKGDVATAWSEAPEDAETYREETQTRFSVTDGLIESSVRELRQYADSAGRNLLRGYTTTDADGHTTYHTTERGEVSDYTGRSETRQLSRPLRAGEKYTFSIEGWYKAAGGSAGLSLTLRGPSGNKIVGAELPLSQQGAASVTLEVPALSEDGTFTQGDLDAARLHIFTLYHPSDITFSRFMLVAGEDTVPYAEAQEDAPMRRHETESKITQTADAINLSVEDKVSSVRSEIAVGTRMISLSVGEDAVPLGTPPFHNLLRYTNQGKRDWAAANSIHGVSAFAIGETERDGKRFAALARNDRSGTTEPAWEWMRYYGLAPRTIKSGGQYTLSFDMDARCKGAFSLGFIMQDTTETADAASTRLNPTVSKSFTPTEGDKYNDPIFGQCYRIRATVSVVLTASADGTLDAGNLRIGTSGQSLNILALVIGDLMLTAGTEARAWTPSTADWADAMEKTGINIAERRLTLTADTVEVRNNSGVTTALLDKDGMLQTDRIRANELTVQHVTAGDPDGERVVVDPATRHIDIYDDKGEQVAIFEGNKYTAEEDLFTSNAQVTEIEADTPLLSIKCGNQSGGATYPNHDEETANAQMMRFYVATPCRAKFECSVNVTGRVNGNTARPNYTYGKGRITLEKEGGGYGSTSTLSYAENREVPASGLGGSLENNASAQDRTLNLTKGWYVVKAYAECLTSDYGTVTVSCHCPKVTLSYDEYVGRYFGNGFCIGKPGNFILANFTNEDGVSLRICSGGNDIRFGKGGMQVRDGDRWRSVKLELYS